MRELIFLLEEDKFVLQALLSQDATGPLTPAKIQAVSARMDEPLSEERKNCVSSEIEDRARASGDPETLDPAAVEFVPIARWPQLDPAGQRIMLAQVISPKAVFVCPEPGSGFHE